VNILEEGDYFGEIALITNLKRTATVRAMDFCTLAYLGKAIFISTKDEYPEVY